MSKVNDDILFLKTVYNGENVEKEINVVKKAVKKESNSILKSTLLAAVISTVLSLPFVNNLLDRCGMNLTVKILIHFSIFFILLYIIRKKLDI